MILQALSELTTNPYYIKVCYLTVQGYHHGFV